jgi:hypothetical protein
MNQQEMQAVASAAANSVIDSVIGELLRRLAQSEARAAGANLQELRRANENQSQPASPAG